MFDVEPVSRNGRIHQAEKPIELLEQIIEFVTEEKEWILDQFAGSFVSGEAALKSGRNSICVEISEEYFQQGKERMQQVQGKGKNR